MSLPSYIYRKAAYESYLYPGTTIYVIYDGGDYIVGFALPQTSSYSFIFTPATNVVGSTLNLRGTGGITLSITY